MSENHAFGVIFDLNGVIVDDIPFHKLAWFDFCKEHGLDLSPERFEREFNGRTNPQILRLLLGEDLGRAEIKRYSADKEGIYRKLFAERRKLMPGLKDLLAELHAHAVPVGIASGAPPENVDFILDATGIREFFAAIVDESKVENGKPSPDVYLRAAFELGVPPERCLVFEDGLLGIQAARTAGMKVIGVTTTHAAAEFPQLDDVIADFTAVDYRRLQGLWR
jgi:beta-phosphoglucomutase